MSASTGSTESRWTVRAYREGDEQGILALFNEVFAEYGPPFEPRTMDHWRWQFQDNPSGHHTYVAEDPRGRIIGNYASIVGTWVHTGRELTGAQAVDTCVAKEYRRSLKREGLFLSLARAYFDDCGRPEKDQIIYGFPNHAAYRVGTRILEYLPVHSPVRMLVRDFDEEWIAYLGPMGADQVDVREVEHFDPAVTSLFERHMSDLPLVQKRDAAYLDWRFARCPVHDYKILEARGKQDGTLRGVLVMRTTWPSRPLSPMVDWVVDPRDREAVAGLVAAAARLAHGAGRCRLATWVPEWSSIANTLTELGMAWDSSDFNLCIRIFGPEFDAQWARDHWYVTMGDSDIF